MNKNKSNGNRGLSISILLAFCVTVLLVAIYSITLSNTLSNSVLNDAIESSISRTDNMYNGVSSFLTDEDFININNKDDASSDAYLTLQSHLSEIRSLNSTRYFYTAKRNDDGKLIYLVDGFDKETSDFRYPGDLIEDEMIPYIEKALNGEIVYSQDIVDTTWGHIFTACYPVIGSDGTTVIGALCIETDMKDTYSFIKSNNETLLRSSIIAICVVVLILLLSYVLIRRHRIKAREDEAILMDSLKREQEHAQVINSLSTIYSTIVRIDLSDESYEIIKRGEALLGEFDSSKSLRTFVSGVINRYVDENMVKGLLEFTNPDTIKDRLRDIDTVSFEYLNVKKRWYEARIIVSSRDENNLCDSLLYVSRDFTDEKIRELQLQEQLKQKATEAEMANASKTDFLRRMSHDIRTPLNAISGMVHIAEKNKDNKEKLKECYEKIQHSIEYLTDIVNNVLDISKLENNALSLEDKSFNLSEMLGKTLPIIETNANEYGIDFKGGIKASHIVHYNLIGSPTHLNRILMNLASNAIKYNKKGGWIKLYCNELSCNDGVSTFEFVCEDNGLGMSEDFQKHCFEPFSREGKQTTTTFSGTGLGLAIVKEIVEKMNGTISLTSEENKGSKFVLTIPFKVDNLPSNNNENKANEALDLTGKHALVVEDNAINMEIASMLLEEQGLIVTKAFNGKEAVDVFSSSEINHFDYIFMDMMMPVMDGISATKEIRKLDRSDSKTVMIIAMTANAFVEDKQECIDAGMNGHVGKPIDGKMIKEAIIEVNKQKKSM